MRRRLPQILLLAFVLLSVILLILGKKQQRYQWYEDYRIKNTQPYGAYFIYNLLKDYTGGQLNTFNKPVAQSLDSTAENTNYILVANTNYYSNQDLEVLLAYVRNGNTAFLSTNNFIYDILEVWDGDKKLFTMDGYNDSTVTVNFMEAPLSDPDGFKYEYFIDHKKYMYSWLVIDSINREGVRPLSTLDGRTTFLRVDYGKGRFYYHPNPILFSNFHLVDEGHLQYAERVFSHLNQGSIFWDEFSKIRGFDQISGGSPLAFILENNTLRWAWYTLLFMVVIYFSFFIKRRQRPVPVINQPENSSIEFVETVGKLYLNQRLPLKLVKQHRELFLGYVREKYNIHQPEISESDAPVISQRAGVSEAEVVEIFKEYRKLLFFTDIGDEQMAEFYQLLEKFYNKCK